MCPFRARCVTVSGQVFPSQVLADVRAGAPFTVAMEALALRVAGPVVARSVDGVVIAVERGTPLAGVRSPP